MADSASRSLLAPSDEYAKPQHARSGRRTIFKLPLLITSFVTLLTGCITAAVIVLLTAHEDPVGSWRVQPSVVLSLLAGIYILLLGGLFTISVVVTWWRSLAQGTTLRELHYIHAGASPKAFFCAFLAGSHARRVALSAVVVFAAKVAVGPMLQRSIRPSLRDATRTIDMKIDIVQEIPENWFGTWGSLSADALATSQDSLLSRDITTEDIGGYTCPTPGSCEATIVGAGLNFDCTTSSQSIDMLDPRSENATVFSIDLTLSNDTGLSVLYLDAVYVSAVADDCTATLTTETCMMIPATMIYPIHIEGSFITPDYTAVLDKPEIVSNRTSAADEYTEDLNAPAGPLKGIEGAMSAVFASRALLSSLQDGKASSYALASGSKAAFWARMFRVGEAGYSDSVADKCPLVWDSPRSFVMGRILDYMFRSAQAAAHSDDKTGNVNDPNQDGGTQNFEAVYSNEELFYITDLRWLVTSAAIMLFGTLPALWLLWGWWQLDRYVTLSPLETAKALGAPVCSPTGSEKEAKAIIHIVGNEKVAFDGDELVWNGTIYTTDRNSSGQPHKYTANATSPDPSTNSSPAEPKYLERRRRRSQHKRSPNTTSLSPTRPSFQHSRGATTRRPYDDEEETLMRLHGYPRFRSHGDNTMPMPPSFAAFTQHAGGGPTLPPIPPTGRICMEEEPSPRPSGRGRPGARGRMEVRQGEGRRLSRIEEGGVSGDGGFI